MAARTLPKRISDWCEILTSTLDRRSRKYFIPVVLGMVLATGRRMVSSWLRKDAALFDLPEPVKYRSKGRPRKYGRQRLSLAHRGGHRYGWTTIPMVLYGVAQQLTFKAFLATYRLRAA